ncbi:hypothetical protein [Microbispora sp. NPDC046933]|uniref:hypothetical protein n=1 Tax=Microbispora sp. NPDC046933 TaxID=3155618 RepID=UPI0033F4BF3F
MAELVPNPLYLALRDTLSAAEPMLTEIADEIETQYRAFHSGRVWTGPAAQRFDEQLTLHRTRVRGCADAVLSDLRRILASTSPEVTAEQARDIKTRYGLT